jgi:hypothetical protein
MEDDVAPTELGWFWGVEPTNMSRRWRWFWPSRLALPERDDGSLLVAEMEAAAKVQRTK